MIEKIKLHESYSSKSLFKKYCEDKNNMSCEEYIELGKCYREIDENRFKVHTYEYSDSDGIHYKYHISSSFRMFLDDFNSKLSSEGLSEKQVRFFVARHSHRALIIKNLYEKSRREQKYSTICEKMWNAVLGTKRNTCFIDALVDCGAIVRVYNASGTRHISSVYSLNEPLLKQIYDRFDSIPDFWKNCQSDAEIDDETFEELSNGHFSETVSVFQDNVTQKENVHENFVEFCANKNVKPDEQIIQEINSLFENTPFRNGVKYKLDTVAQVAQVYYYLREFVEDKAQVKVWRKIAHSVQTNAHSFIKYEASIHIHDKVLEGVGIRATTELCTKPKYETLLKRSEEIRNDELRLEFEEDIYSKSREFILEQYGNLVHFDASSSIPHVQILMNTGEYKTGVDLYAWFAHEDKLTPIQREIYKQSYMQSHFSGDSSVSRIYNNIRYGYRMKDDEEKLEWVEKNKDKLCTYIANVKTETPDGFSTMDFYHESNIFILLRKYWTIKKVKVIAQVYDSFWFKDGCMTEERFNEDLKMIAELYYENYISGGNPEDILRSFV